MAPQRIARPNALQIYVSVVLNFELAKIVFNWICDRKYEDGSYWCGFTSPDLIIWPQDKITWTNPVALLAADALYNLTPAGQIFSHDFWQNFDFSVLISNPFNLPSEKPPLLLPYPCSSLSCHYRYSTGHDMN